jgi:GNAT superfamily N-acetyltransferase
MSTRLELIDTATASEEKLRRLHEFYIMRDTWDIPDDAPMPFEQRLVGWRYFGEGARRVPRWILWDGGTVAATSGVALENFEDNRDNCWGFAYVHPDHRGKGFSRQVISLMVAAAPELWRTEERAIEGRQITNYTYVARHKPTGEFAGYTNVFYQRLHPLQAHQIDTETAGSNEPMLNINIALGFKPVLETRTWQGDIATIRANLEV